MIRAVHAVVIHEYLMDTLLPFEPYDIHAGEAGLCTGSGSGVQLLDGYPFGKEIELHCKDVSGRRATDFGAERYSELRAATRRARLRRC